jgi:hypothetical protein
VRIVVFCGGLLVFGAALFALRLEQAPLVLPFLARELEDATNTPGSPIRLSIGEAAVAWKACRDGFSVLYRRAPRLFADLATARGEGRLARLVRSLELTRLLIIDDWDPEPLNAEQRRDLLEIVDDREGKGSLLITSQVPIGRWHEIIGDPTLGDAILDRVIHRSHRIELKG